MKKILLPIILTALFGISIAMANSDTADATPSYNSKLSLGFEPAVQVKTNVRRVGFIVGQSEAQINEAQKAAEATSVQVISSAPAQTAAPEYSADLGSLRALYQEASAKYGIDWQLVEAVHQVETGKSITCKTSYAGAKGPMQFLPSTFRHYAEPGANICDLRDSVFAAANLLANAGADRGDIDGALLCYNHSMSYIQKVKSVMDSI